MQIGIDSFAAAFDEARLAASSAVRPSELLERIERADQVGLDVFGIGEHHRREFLDSAPPVILAAAAARTKHKLQGHQILVMRPHLAGLNDEHVDQATDLYSLRISGHLGPAALSAFLLMVAQLQWNDTLLIGVLDRSALYGVLAEVAALGLYPVELRRLLPRRNQST